MWWVDVNCLFPPRPSPPFPPPLLSLSKPYLIEGRPSSPLKLILDLRIGATPLAVLDEIHQVDVLVSVGRRREA